ncbi:hypothetical protein VW35_15660 [Devosia soli]|uniref:DUF982 domain-containing protein n=1 Tax=Devosia soli TaxID=361041 RepID=A0A0F5L4N2_9HYPH|nr:DUF982 domain-containing protein [Devosia soli]KKB77154.1 hypothetical protein VW35_15660 [Devosia soli]
MLDTLHTWERPLTITLNGEPLVVVAPAQARNILLLDWPAERGDKHKIASDLCLAAMEGANPEPAYLAFMDATIEAGIFVE